MPSLIRFIVTIGIIAGLIYAAMFALVLYVEPEPRAMSERVPTEQINPVRIPTPAPAADDETEATE